MSKPIYPDKCSYYFAPHDNWCVYCDSGSMAIMNRPGLESSSYLWQCLACQWYQIQDLKPPKEFSTSWADIVDAEVPLGQAASVSWDDINRLIREDAEGEAREENEYDPMCCDPYYEEPTDIDSFPNQYTITRIRPRGSSLPEGDHTLLPWEAASRARSETTLMDKEPAHPQPPPGEPKPACSDPACSDQHGARARVETAGEEKGTKSRKSNRHGQGYLENRYAVMADTGALVSLGNAPLQGIGPVARPVGRINQPFDLPRKMEEQQKRLLEERRQVQRNLVDVRDRLRKAESALGSCETTTRESQDSTHPGEEGTHIKVNLPLSDDTWNQDEIAKPTFTYANPGSYGMEVEIDGRGSLSADDEPYFKRARVCSTFTKPQISWEQDKMED